jgi:hypothetical protein
VPIEIVELSLVSTAPITVTYYGGMYPELWDVRMTVSRALSSPGMMLIQRGYPEGGGYSGMYTLYPSIVFRRVSDGTERVWDLGLLGVYDYYQITEGWWEYWTPPPGSCTSNFCAGMGSLVIHLAANGRHDVYAVCPAPLPGDVDAGFDLCETDSSSTYRDFSGAPVPADFFGPGSDPFDGIIYFSGLPLGESPFCPQDDLAEVDRIVERQGTAHLPSVPSQETVGQHGTDHRHLRRRDVPRVVGCGYDGLPYPPFARRGDHPARSPRGRHVSW